jgi:1-deoxy-D-xylulose-5-phosphate reductoisomerase
MRGVVVLGSTGSIGVNTLDVLSRHRDRFSVVALTAGHNLDRLWDQCREHRPRLVAVREARDADALRARARAAGMELEVHSGPKGIAGVACADGAEIVMAAIVGAAGLLPTLEAVRAGRRVLIANKEPLVMLGDLFLTEARASGALLIPVDSEHNAIFQCLPAAGDHDAVPVRAGGAVRRVWLTASGGPFRTWEPNRLPQVTPEQACAHPNWVMGRKISVDSATMMNKGLEIIEACRLFSLNAEQVEVVIHPQSTVHSLVEYADGSLLAQLGAPDMRIPIAHALAWPERIDSGASPLDPRGLASLEFSAPDHARFPCLVLCQRAARAGGTVPAILNAANEEAVAAFLDKRIRFTDIYAVNAGVLDALPGETHTDMETVLGADARARAAARVLIARLGSPHLAASG